MRNEKGEPPGVNFSVSSVLQSTWLQRSVCWYNDAHRYLLGCCARYVLYSGRAILNLLGIKMA